MKYLLTLIFFVIQLILAMNLTFAQGNNEKKTPLSFFLDCEDCDFSFVRQELTFVPFVRDPKMADVHILVTDSETGSGGNKYFLNFIGLNEFKGADYEYTIFTKQSDNDYDKRKFWPQVTFVLFEIPT